MSAPRPYAVLPSASSAAEVGASKCNAPFVVDGVVVGYCDLWVYPRSRRARKRNHDGQRHRLEWGDNYRNTEPADLRYSTGRPPTFSEATK